MMTYCSKFSSQLLPLLAHWVSDLFLSIFQIIEIISLLKKYHLKYFMIPVTYAFLGIFTLQIISIYTSFSGLSSELVKSVIFFHISSYNRRITAHFPYAQSQLMP